MRFSRSPIKSLLYITVYLLGVGCVQTRPSEFSTADVPAPLIKAQRLFEIEKSTQALETIDRYLSSSTISSTDKGAAHLLSGEIYFALQKYREAKDQFKLAHKTDSANPAALHRTWAATLMENPDEETRGLVKHEIAQLSNRSMIDANGLLAAYYGYSYLWDQKSKTRIFKRLLSSPKSPEIDSELPHMIMDEMLSIRSNDEQTILAQKFIIRYPNDIYLPTVLAQVFSHPQPGEKLEQFVTAEKIRDIGSPYLKYYVANYLYNKGEDGGIVNNLAEQLLASSDQPGFLSCENKMLQVSCTHYRNRLISDIYRLKAELLVNQNKFEKALNAVARATQYKPASYKAWSVKGRVHMMLRQRKQAEDSFIVALSINPKHKPSQRAIAKLENKTISGNLSHRRILATRNSIPFFSDITRSAGLAGISAQRIAWGDFNNDGFDDLIIDGRRLLQNSRGHGFTDVTRQSGIVSSNSATGGLFVDYNNDGLLDILITGRQTLLYKNTGPLKFELARSFNKKQQRRTVAASWGDINNDGFPDLYLANYEKNGVRRSICYQDQLFINLAGEGFEDQSTRYGIPSSPPLCGRGVSWADFDQDGHPEIVISNYRLNRNRLLSRNKNHSSGPLLDVARNSRFQSKLNGHSIASLVADFDGDSKPDIYLSNLAHPRYLDFSEQSALLINKSRKNKIWFKKAKGTGIIFSETNSDIAAADIDNDGDLDLYVSSIYPNRFGSLYLNDGSGIFENASWLSNTQVENSWGVAFSDFDNDGDADLLVASQDGIRLFRNDSRNHNSVSVNINSPNCQKNGIGTKLWLSTDSDTQYREVQAGKGTGTQDSTRISFGLGRYQGNINVRAADTCGNEFQWSGPHSSKTITIP